MPLDLAAAHNLTDRDPGLAEPAWPMGFVAELAVSAA